MATILIVDDRPINRQFLQTLLGYVGHVTHDAADGLQALRVARSVLPDLVITDILMPEMDGVEFARQLRADPALAAIPVIFFTATYRVPEARKLAETCGVTAVLPKPSEPQAILDAVNAVLGASAAPAPETLPEARSTVPPLVANQLSEHLQDLSDLQLRMRRIVNESLALVGHPGESSPDTEGLAGSLGEMQAVGLRLAALIELGLDLASQRNAAGLLDLFCRAAQDIMSARYAAIGVLDAGGHRLRLWASRGLSDAADDAFATADPLGGILGKAVATGRPQLLRVGGRPAETGLPAAHPQVSDMVAVPVRSPTRSYGWLYLADKLGGAGFSDEDLRVAGTLAAQLALAYENLTLYEDLQRHSGQLEAEIAERIRAESGLRESEERYRQLAENIREVFFVVNRSVTEIVYVSPAYEEIWGRSCASLYANPHSWAEALHPEDSERVTEALALTSSLGQIDIEYRILRPDGAIRWIRARGFPIRTEKGEVYRMAGLAEDVTDRHAHQESIARLNRGFAILSGINSAIVRIHDRQALAEEVCRIAIQTGGFRGVWIGWRDPDSAEMRCMASQGVGQCGFVPAPGLAPSGAGGRQEFVDETLRSGTPHVCRDPRIHDDGDSCQCQACGCQAAVALPLTLDGLVNGALVLCAGEDTSFAPDEMRLLEEVAGDVSFGLQYIAREEQLQYLAYYDALTGLANAVLFQDRLGRLLSQAERDGTMVATILLDIDRFTYINESLGRHVGDAVLKMVGERLGQAMRDADCVARPSADRFAIAVAGLGGVADVVALMRERIIDALLPPFRTGETEVGIRIHAGISLYPHDGGEAESLFKNAESALKEAKLSDQPYCFYGPAVSARFAQRLEMENALRGALDAGQFAVYYQPRVDLASGRVVGAEALVRWIHPEKGVIPPDQFIPLAEESGLIVPLGDQVIGMVCAQQAAWLESHVDVVPVAVNLSGRQLRDARIVDVLRKARAAHGLDANHLELEITESVLMERPEETSAILRSLRQEGMRIALDDFGTGYSSLAYLRRFPIDYLKIDRAFITHLTHEPDDAAIATAIIAMSHRLKLRVVAEGVETEAQLRYLRRHGCNEIQGFHFSPPVPKDAFEAMLRSGKCLPGESTALQAERTLLLVDDEPGVLSALRRVFRRDGYRILTASNGPEALEILAANDVQVIVADQRMPGMPGSEFLSVAKELYPDTIRMILSGYAEITAVVEAVNRGAVFKFLLKPWDDDLLREHVRDGFRRYRPTLTDDESPYSDSLAA